MKKLISILCLLFTVNLFAANPTLSGNNMFSGSVNTFHNINIGTFSLIGESGGFLSQKSSLANLGDINGEFANTKFAVNLGNGYFQFMNGSVTKAWLTDLGVYNGDGSGLTNIPSSSVSGLLILTNSTSGNWQYTTNAGGVFVSWTNSLNSSGFASSIGTIVPTNLYSQVLLGSNTSLTVGTRQYLGLGVDGNTNMIQMSGQASGNGTGPLTNTYVEIPSLVSSSTNKVTYNQTAASITCFYRTPVGITNIYEVGGSVTVKAIAAGTVTGQVVFTDETGTIRTYNLVTAGAVTTGFFGFTSTTIIVSPNTDITVQAITGGGTQTFNTSGWITLKGVAK